MFLDTKAWACAEQAIEREGRDEVMVGSWHCHPGTLDRRPSHTDLRGWLSMLDFCARRRRSSQAHVGLIYSAAYDAWRGESTWARPKVSAWIVRRDGWGSSVCEPARIV